MQHVVVLCGGRSAEHEVSLVSAASILKALDPTRYRISVIGIRKDGSTFTDARLRNGLELDPEDSFSFPRGGHWVSLLIEMNPPPDIVFPVLHGPFGEDGTVQGVLEVLGLPYVGAGVCGSAVAMNKILAKRILAERRLPVLPFVETSRALWEEAPERFLSRVEEKLAYPVFVKPANLGSSVGINKSRDRREVGRHVETAFRYDDSVLVEQGIEAREIEVSVLGNLRPRASVPGEILPGRDFYDYEAKYLDDRLRLLIPAPLSREETERVRDLALAAYRSLQLEGMGRVDFLMDRQSGNLWVSEANTIPGFTPVSMYPKLWEASGLSFPQLLDELIGLGLERHRRRSFSVER